MQYQLLTCDDFRRILSYDQETGSITWVARNNRRKAGERAGRPSVRGCIVITLHKRSYYAHRIAWLMVYGIWPDGIIDHINGDPADNRIANLRIASKAQNSHNRGRQKNNRSGFKGVCWHKRNKTWQASIVTCGKRKHLGRFDSAEEASAAYEAAALELHGEFART